MLIHARLCAASVHLGGHAGTFWRLHSAATMCASSMHGLPAGAHVIHIWSVDTRAAQGLRTCFASEEYFSSSHAGSLMMKKSRSLFCTGIAAGVRCAAPAHALICRDSAAATRRAAPRRPVLRMQSGCGRHQMHGSVIGGHRGWAPERVRMTALHHGSIQSRPNLHPRRPPAPHLVAVAC